MIATLAEEDTTFHLGQVVMHVDRALTVLGECRPTVQPARLAKLFSLGRVLPRVTAHGVSSLLTAYIVEVKSSTFVPLYAVFDNSFIK